MCGIVGYVGSKNAVPILLNGLDKLEYRGYDSAGLYIMNNRNEGFVFKAKGRINALREEIDPSVQASVGIGHTRWATHGEPSAINAHPHQSFSQRFTLVHNGVIENYQEIKEQYLDETLLLSDTDTEIIVHMLAYFSEKEHLPTLDALRQTLSLLKGSYAIALIDESQPGTIFAAKNKSPLLLGKGEGFNVICSDAMAMIKETNQFVELMDKEIAIVTKDELIIENANGDSLSRDAYTAEFDSEDLEKGAYPYYMAKEIDEQPAVLRRVVQAYQTQEGNLHVDQVIVDAMLQSDRLYIIAAGTSYHAGLVGKRLFEQLSGIPTEVHVASEFGYHMPILSNNPFFIFISQSGETADSRQVLVSVNEKNYPSLTITNAVGSTLSRESTFTLLLHAGPEIAVASTKAYTAQISVMAILSEVIGLEKGVITESTMKHNLSTAAVAIQSIIESKELIEDLASKQLSLTDHAFFIGRGLDHLVALEAALKLKEISYIHTEGFAAGELKHGTIALIEKGTPIIAFVTEKTTAGHTRGNVQETIARGANTVIISMDGLSRPEDHVIIPEVHPLLTPLVSVIPAQLLAYYASLHRGNDVDKPRNLAKSVTVE
ncbi:glutamine--fructose-6-phosphate transaminase (isomerizing) [Alkalibacterium sp. MB6]|uniref:glutamine--fructose-6-phosphate transaminase (isomerizing) n=1 Tax=Alkalibacterium sp. MB6 TaxID=2081965 RepID=UPI00137B54C4|nr:glutamine--fructose-6-phosphate transaminase (isomerizing) [Alkalibacterium sp. MB6]